jgi:hypothetical protein
MKYFYEESVTYHLKSSGITFAITVFHAELWLPWQLKGKTLKNPFLKKT